jgi:peroxiredoxin/uncharacterized membrane protein YphA (DoxX/SURF4 family)
MPLVLLAARLLLAAVFALAGFGKLADPSGSRKSLVDFGVPPFLASPLALLLPVVELLCALALLPGRWAWYGAAGVLAMLLLFLAAIAISMARGRTPDCHCFGQLHSEPVGWKTLARNGLLSVVAALILWQGPGASLVGWWRGWNHLEFVVLALGLAVAGLAAFTLWLFSRLLGQYGRLLLRLEAVESRLGVGPAAPPPPGLPIGSSAPAFSLPGLDGRLVTLDALNDSGAPVLLVFIEPGCDACESLLPHIAEWQREPPKRLQTALISRGTVEANRAKSDQYQLLGVLLQTDREVAQAYHVDATPSGVLIAGGRITSALAVGPDAIRGLVARTLLPQLSKGDQVPTLRLPDLDGKAIDLGALRGRSTLLLFWAPSCGFCQNMLPDLKLWERDLPSDGPRLLVISTGSPEDNRKQGLRSPVLLDPSSSALHVFGAGGTPTAVMLDEQGRVASGVEVGAEAVLALGSAVRPAARQ